MPVFISSSSLLGQHQLTDGMDTELFRHMQPGSSCVVGRLHAQKPDVACVMLLSHLQKVWDEGQYVMSEYS